MGRASMKTCGLLRWVPRCLCVVFVATGRALDTYFTLNCMGSVIADVVIHAGYLPYLADALITLLVLKGEMASRDCREVHVTQYLERVAQVGTFPLLLPTINAASPT